MKLSAIPGWKFITDNDEVIDPVLLELLRFLKNDPKLTHAARQANISYRHAWNILNKWNQQLGSPLVIQTKGQGTRLSPIGEKLLWAEDLIEARLTPLVSNLSSSISHELNGLLNKQKDPCRIHASHGYAIDVLSKLISRHDHDTVDIRYMGSKESLESLINQNCDLAGFHLCTHRAVRNPIANKHYQLLDNSEYTIIRMVIRNQGFIVQKSNPRSLKYLSDLTLPDIIFINRQKSAGTRILLDELLNQCKIEKEQINGYNNEEYTHTAVAAHVASGAADIGFGIEYAAHKFNLEFIPIVSEQYVLACKSNTTTSTTITSILSTIRSHEFAKEVCELPGYELDLAGTLVNAKEFLSDKPDLPK